MGLQIAQTLLVLAIDDARAPNGHATYGKVVRKLVRYTKVTVLDQRTSATAAEAIT